jgi:peroxiredoxin
MVDHPIMRVEACCWFFFEEFTISSSSHRLILASGFNHPPTSTSRHAPAYVMDAFLQSLGPIAQGRVTMLADGNHELSKALGLAFDASARGMGMRVQRFAMVVDGEGVIKDIQVDAAGAIKATRAGHLLSRL